MKLSQLGIGFKGFPVAELGNGKIIKAYLPVGYNDGKVSEKATSLLYGAGGAIAGGAVALFGGDGIAVTALATTLAGGLGMVGGSCVARSTNDEKVI